MFAFLVRLLSRLPPVEGMYGELWKNKVMLLWYSNSTLTCSLKGPDPGSIAAIAGFFSTLPAAVSPSVPHRCPALRFPLRVHIYASAWDRVTVCCNAYRRSVDGAFRWAGYSERDHPNFPNAGLLPDRKVQLTFYLLGLVIFRG